MYRSVSTSIWADDSILSMSPEQKLLFLYLHTNPYASACGIYKLQLRTMGFQLGLIHAPMESALKGLCAAFPDFVAVDWATMEVALLQYPGQTLITAGTRVLAHVGKEIEKVESQYLLRELIARNSATLSKPYLAHLRRLQMERINEDKNHGDLLQVVDVQQDDRKREIEKEIEKEREREERARDEDFEIPIFAIERVKSLNWMEVSELLFQHSQGEGKAEWEYMKANTGYQGDGRDVFGAWAGKNQSAQYTLQAWKENFPKLQTWMQTQARADLKARPKQYQQPADVAVPVPQFYRAKR